MNHITPCSRMCLQGNKDKNGDNINICSIHVYGLVKGHQYIHIQYSLHPNSTTSRLHYIIMLCTSCTDELIEYMVYIPYLRIEYFCISYVLFDQIDGSFLQKKKSSSKGPIFLCGILLVSLSWYLSTQK